MKSLQKIATTFGCYALLTGPAFAQLPQPRLEAVFPLGGQAGQTVEVSIQGDDLDGAERLVFSHPGLTAAVVMTAADRFYPEPRLVGGKLNVTIALDVPPGIYDVRAVGVFGISNARRFAVGASPQVIETEPNDDLSQATEIALETVVNGRCDERNYDCFRFTGAPGQRVTLHCVSRRLNSPAQAVMVLLDSSGIEVARSRPALNGDSVIEFTVPAEPASPYIVKVYDFLYGGGERHAYRLHLTAGPWEEPAPASTSVYPASPPGGPITTEQEPNDSSDQVQRIYPPAEITGSFDPRNDADWLSFEARKGEVLALELFSQRLGAPTDPFLVVQRILPDGARQDVQEADDAIPFTLDKNNPLYRYPIHHGDPSMLFTAPEDGTYGLLVRDLFFSSQGDPRHVWRLAIRPPQPGFALVAFPYQSNLRQPRQNIDLVPVAPVVLRGGTEPIFVHVLRRPGFDGEVRLEAQDLPGGVTADPVIVPGWRNHGVLVLKAAVDAPAGAGPIRIVGKATGPDGAEIAIDAAAAENLTETPAGTLVDAQPVSALHIAVAEDYAAPVAIDLGEPKVYEIARGTKLQVPIKLLKPGQLKGDLTLAAVDQHPMVRIANIVLNEKQLEQPLTIDVDAGAPEGIFSFYLHGLATVVHQRNPKALEIAQQDKQRIEKLLGESPQPPDSAAAAAGEEAKKRAEQRVTELTASTAAKDIQLPVTSPVITIRVTAPAPAPAPAPAAAAP